MHFPAVDVRDCARAHILALENEKAHGRYLTSNNAWWLKDIAAILKKKYPNYPIPSKQMPVFFLRLFAVFDKRISPVVLKQHTMERCAVDGTKIVKELGFKYEFDAKKQTTIDAAKSMIELGIIKNPKKKIWKESNNLFYSNLFCCSFFGAYIHCNAYKTEINK